MMCMANMAQVIRFIRHCHEQGVVRKKTFDFNFNYRPLSWLSFDAGMRYRSYWAVDDFLNKSLQSEIDPSLNPLFTKKVGLKNIPLNIRPCLRVTPRLSSV